MAEPARSHAFCDEQLEELRGLASQYGVALELVDRLTLRPAEVARVTGIALRTVRQWIATERLPACKIDNLVLVPVLDLLRFLDAHPYVGSRRQESSLRDRAADFIEEVSQ